MHYIRSLSIILAAVFFIFPNKALSQNFKTVNKTANEYFLIKNYNKALPLLLWMDSVAPGSAELSYKIGVCYLGSTPRSSALPYLEKAKKSGLNTPGIDFNLGVAYHLNTRMDEAISCFETARARLNPVKDRVKVSEINRHIEICRNAKEIMAKPINVQIENLGPSVNTACAEYAPVTTADESMLLFTSPRPCDVSLKTENEDIYISLTDSTNSWKPAVNAGKYINSPGHEASLSISADGKKLFIYKDEDIYISESVSNSWNKPVKLPPPVNSTFWEPSASITPDGKTLFFVSDRPGGVGGRDIYKSIAGPDGRWSAPLNLGPGINTVYDEDAPFIHPDGTTLYFCSEGHKSMGGFDIFSSVYDGVSGNWSAPVNVGYPINTVEDDMFFVWSADGKRGYFSSDREGGFGEKDLYKVIREEVHVSLTMFKGLIKDEDEHPIKAKIIVFDNETNKVLGNYESDAATGKFLVFLIPGKNYGITFSAENYIPYSENVWLNDRNYKEISANVLLKPIEKGGRIILKNVFFDSGKTELKKESFGELGQVISFLKKNSQLKVEISGHTDSIGTDEQNLILSTKRAEEVVNYIVSKGVDRMRLSAIGRGEKEPIGDNGSEEGRKLNRRTEFFVIRKNTAE
jgi:outer membrane protein OmpA-like peptidoglycan-associated protein/Tol biopolymer transport system component